MVYLRGRRKDYFKCFQSAMFSSVISPAPEMRLISSSFLLIAMAVVVEVLVFFVDDKAVEVGKDF